MNQNEEIKSVRRPAAEKMSRTQKALCDALLSLLEEQPFEQLTAKEITTRAGVGYATFFRRYGDKEALLRDLAAGEIRTLLMMTLPLFHTVDSESSTRALCAYVWENRRLWAVLLTGGAAAAMKEEYLRQSLELAATQPNPEPWLPGELAVRFAVVAMVEVLAWWLSQTNPLSVKQMADIANRLAVAPILPQGARPDAD